MSHPQSDRPANRLAGETSPYLLQHAHNPVDWYPWGPEALARAKAEDRPIFLSVGYSACHWCHVMERESFEDPQIAALMNEYFINVKVDREERPDLDQIYMAAVQAMTEHGGWPMSVFLTPDLQPFYGGTYFPPTESRGMPGFPLVLRKVHQAWVERRDDIVRAAGDLTERISLMGAIPPAQGGLEIKLIDQAVAHLGQVFDPKFGGFQDHPKFPHPMDLRLLLRHHVRTGDEQSLHMVRLSLEKMARGGIYDHLGGGFARYSTDRRWLVPHFEKMLYDNALLSTTYLEAYQLTSEPEFARVARETMDYILNRMTGPGGEIYSTEDADSEGEEGKYYVWTLAEIQEILGHDRARAFVYVYDVTESGNWEQKTVLNLPRTLTQASIMLGRDPEELRTQIAEDRQKLLEVRERRVPPGKDTKVLASWNGLMITPLAEGARILKDDRYLAAARRAARFLLENMTTSEGLILHAYKDGRARFNAYLDDYANVIDGLTRLYEVSGEVEWLDAALKFVDVILDRFLDKEAGGFFYTGRDHESLIVRQKDFQDNAAPSGNAMAATALLRLAALTGRKDLESVGRRVLETIQLFLDKAPMAMGQSLLALDLLLAPSSEIAVFAGSDASEFREALETVYSTFLPHKVVAPVLAATAKASSVSLPLLEGREARDGRTTTYICENSACQEPIVGLEGLAAALRS